MNWLSWIMAANGCGNWLIAVGELADGHLVGWGYVLNGALNIAFALGTRRWDLVPRSMKKARGGQ